MPSPVQSSGRKSETVNPGLPQIRSLIVQNRIKDSQTRPPFLHAARMENKYSTGVKIALATQLLFPRGNCRTLNIRDPVFPTENSDVRRCLCSCPSPPLRRLRTVEPYGKDNAAFGVPLRFNPLADRPGIIAKLRLASQRPRSRLVQA